jgi:cation-transporting ATPase E
MHPDKAGTVGTVGTAGTAALPDGLCEAEVEARRARGESNAFHSPTSRTYVQILRYHAFSFINTVLFAIGIALVALGRIDDAVLTAGMVVLNVVLGVGQEGRAKHRLDQIALLTRPKATVIREAKVCSVDPGEIVLGDILQVLPGDQIVVDGQVVDGRMEVDESLLTGESERVARCSGERVYSGSFCTAGRARYVATVVGASSFANQMTASARSFRQVKTPLQKDVDFIVRLLVVLATVLGILIALSFVYTFVPLVERVQIAAVLAALVPQGLFVMITVTYAVAALRMAGKGALIQQINAIESLSNVDVLCLDKTGTLTTNALKLEKVKSLGASSEELVRQLGDYVASSSESNRTAEAIGDACAGRARTIREEVAFSSAHKWSALAFDDHDPQGVYVLGAPEILQGALKPGTELRSLSAWTAKWAERGLRVLLFAHAPRASSLYDSMGEAQLPRGLVPLGLLSLRDELRPEAESALRDFASAGVQIKIISGDNPDTVASLARQAGLHGAYGTHGAHGAHGGAALVSGLDLATMNEEQFADAAVRGVVFGRITPAQKERLVRVLRSKGHYVAMIGDGVNDVLSLKQAQLAIAMQSGSQAARAVADIVLLDDSFALLPKAVLEGQRVVRGMQDVMRMVLTHTLFVGLLIIACAIVDVAFPTTPKLRSLLTILTVGIPTLAIAGWAKPGPLPTNMVSSVLRFVLPAGFTITGVGLTVYLCYLLFTQDVDLARTGLTTAVLLCGLLLIPFVQPPTPAWAGGDELSGDWRPTILAVALLAIYVVVLLTPPLRQFFALTQLPPGDVLLVGGVVAVWGIALRFTWRKRLLERLLTADRR